MPKPSPLIARLLPSQRARWLATLAGAVALALAAWFVAPLVVVAAHRPMEELWPRAVMTALILMVWALANLRIDGAERRANERLVVALTRPGPDGRVDPDARGAAEEIGVLEERLNGAVARLKGLRFGALWGGRYLYQLPWYLVIGAPGSGKSTALAASELGFPLDGRPQALAMPGFGGTRWCDWWFTDEAVLIDTAGRYTTQDSRQAVDSRVWSGLLELLKEHRPRQPLNGVVLTVSLKDLAEWSPAERRQHAGALRQRLIETRRQLRLAFPIYVVCTKADLVAGFTGFFDTLSSQERRQVWGTTFALGEGPNRLGPVAGFRDAFQGLLRRLDERVLERLHQEPDIDRRGQNFAFPLQIATLEAPLADLLETAFAAGPGEEPLALRGVYFTSATQGGTAVDRLAAPLADFRVSPAPGPADDGPTDSFFLARLMREVIFAEANLASVDRAFERRRSLTKALAVTATLGVAMALGVYWQRSYSGNLEMIQRVDAATTRADETLRRLDIPEGALTRITDADFATLLPALDALRTLASTPAARGPLAEAGLAGGLHQGARLGRLGLDAYRRSLRSLFLSRVVVRLEEVVRTSWARPEILRPALIAYLMVGGRQPMDASFFSQWLIADWRRALPGAESAERRQALGAHLAALFEAGFASVPLDEALIERAFQVLNQMTPTSNPPVPNLVPPSGSGQLAPCAVSTGCAERA